jgi:hypothetical protein
VCTFIRIHIHIYINIYIYTICTPVYIYIHTHTYTYIHKYIHIHIYTCIHLYKYIHINISYACIDIYMPPTGRGCTRGCIVRSDRSSGRGLRTAAVSSGARRCTAARSRRRRRWQCLPSHVTRARTSTPPHSPTHADSTGSKRRSKQATQKLRRITPDYTTVQRMRLRERCGR